MKVLYKDKVGKLVSLHTSIYCNYCIYRPKGTSLSRCKKVGLMELCVGSSHYYEFRLGLSDVLNL